MKMKFKLILAMFGLFALTSCGTTIEYTTHGGVKLSEKIDGKLAPKINMKRVNLNTLFNGRD